MNLEKLVKAICDEYVKRWKTEGERYINIQSFENAYIESSVTPIELDSTLIMKLRSLNKKDSTIPPAIPLLPLPVLRRLAIHLTRTLEVQVNWDHYEYWAWSAEVFKYLENSSPLLKALKSENAIELLYLLFHICLAKLVHTPSTQEARILNEVIDAVINRHVKHVIYNKFIIGIPIAASALESLLKAFIKTYGPEEARKELTEQERRGHATLGKTLRIFGNKALPRIQQDLQKDLQELNKV